MLNLLVRLLYGRRLSDEATCYKAMPTALFRALDLRAQRFELCAEITAKLCRLGLPIVEVPISYRPRSAAEGKKIGWRDAWSTFWTLLRWRFLPLRQPLLVPQLCLGTRRKCPQNQVGSIPTAIDTRAAAKINYQALIRPSALNLPAG